MLLAIDIGNTRIKWGLHDGTGWLERDAVTTLDALPAHLDALADQVILSNVGAPSLSGMLTRRFGRLHEIHAQPQQCGVRNGYRNPASLGSDRWAALIGAHALGARTALVINAGTALTVDALHLGDFLGGTISPGYRLLTRSLTEATGLHGTHDAIWSGFPDNTASALLTGCIASLTGPITHMHDTLAQQCATQPELWVAGGDAALIATHLTCRTEPHLVLEGLLHIATEVFA